MHLMNVSKSLLVSVTFNWYLNNICVTCYYMTIDHSLACLLLTKINNFSKLNNVILYVYSVLPFIKGKHVNMCATITDDGKLNTTVHITMNTIGSTV